MFVPQVRGSLDYARDDCTQSVVVLQGWTFPGDSSGIICPLNDKTTVEMTIIFLGDRHFDQVKRVEKSPKAKQYYPTTLVLSALLSNDFTFLLHSIYPYFPQRLTKHPLYLSAFTPKQFSNPLYNFLALSQSLISLSPLFLSPLFLFIVVIICYI